MENIKLINVKSQDASFLFRLMNNESILSVLNEVPTTVNDWSNAITEWETDPDEEDYIIFDNSIPIGWIGINGLESINGKVYIKIIALLPEYQNKGIGTYAVCKIIHELQYRNYTRIALYTDKTNIRAQQCYIKCGFKYCCEVTQEMSNGEKIIRVRMERDL